MLAKKYQVEVHESALERSHNMGRVIEEVFIPELGICFNDQGFAFKYHEIRNETKDAEDIEIDDNRANRIAIHVNRHEELQDWLKLFFNGEDTEIDVAVDLNLPEDVMLRLAMDAHDKDLTLSEFINLTFEEYIKDYEGIEESGEVRSINTTTECSSDHSESC